MVHWFVWKQVKHNISRMLNWENSSKTFPC